MDNRITRLAIVSALLLVVSGCKEVLYSNLGEVEANEMVAVLASADIGASREKDKDGFYSVSIDEKYIAAATIHLRQFGLPKPIFDSIGDVFGPDGMVGTPFEQHARFIHALNQEMSHTFVGIEGVVDARVSINSPMAGRNRNENIEASASVAIYHDQSFEPTKNVSKIRQIVAHSVSDVAYEDVAVAFFATRSFSVLPAVMDPVADVGTVTGASIVPGFAAQWKQPSGLAPSLLFGALIALIIVGGALMHSRVQVGRPQGRGEAFGPRNGRGRADFTGRSDNG